MRKHLLRPDASAKLLPILTVAAILLLTLLLYRGIFNITYMADDTMDFIQGRNIIHNEIWYPFIGEGMWRGGPQYYRPLPVISHGLDAVVFGYWPAPHRATQLLFHLVCCAAVYALYRSWFGKERETEASLAALLFALHPVHEYPMWWPGGSRNDVMCGIFYVTAVLCFTAYVRGRRTRAIVLSAASTAAALACKEMAYSLPLICFVVYLIFAEKEAPWRGRLQRAGVAVVPLLAVAAVFMLFRLLRYDVESTLLGVQFDLGHLRATAHAAIRGLVFPFQWSFREVAQARPMVVIAVVMGIAALGVTRLHRLRSPIMLVGAAWIALSLLPVLRTISPWALYIPSVGFCLIAGHVLIPNRSRSGMAAAVLVIALVASYVVQWEQRRLVWREMDQAADQCMDTLRADYKNKPFERALFLDLPGSIGDVPLYMLYFSARLPFEMPDGAPQATVLSMVTFPAGRDQQGVAIEELSPGAWRITAESEKSRFVFPENPEVLYRFDTGDVGDTYQHSWGSSEVAAENPDGQPNAVVVRLSGTYQSWANMPIYYFSKGELHRYRE